MAKISKNHIFANLMQFKIPKKIETKQESKKWPNLEGQVNDSIFNTSWENPKMHIWCLFGDSSSNLLSLRQAKFPRILVKMTLKVKVNYFHLRVS